MYFRNNQLSITISILFFARYWVNNLDSIQLCVILILDSVMHSKRRQASADDRSKIDNILEFHFHIWNHHEKCIKISTNMPGISSLISEIAVQISEM